MWKLFLFELFQYLWVYYEQSLSFTWKEQKQAKMQSLKEVWLEFFFSVILACCFLLQSNGGFALRLKSYMLFVFDCIILFTIKSLRIFQSMRLYQSYLFMILVSYLYDWIYSAFYKSIKCKMDFQPTHKCYFFITIILFYFFLKEIEVHPTCIKFYNHEISQSSSFVNNFSIQLGRSLFDWWHISKYKLEKIFFWQLSAPLLRCFQLKRVYETRINFGGAVPGVNNNSPPFRKVFNLWYLFIVFFSLSSFHLSLWKTS